MTKCLGQDRRLRGAWLEVFPQESGRPGVLPGLKIRDAKIAQCVDELGIAGFACFS